MRPLRRMLCAAAVAALYLAAPLSAAQCRLALALGLDVSGSVDGREYALQLNGLAAALLRPDVTAALLALPESPVSLLVYEWSAQGEQRLLAPWAPLQEQADIAALAARLRTIARQPAAPATALGAAVDVGRRYLSQKPACRQHTLDISGDGKNNIGPHPSLARERAALAEITVNALVIGADAPAHGDTRYVEISELSAYFRAYVITGEDAFVEVALGFEAYEDAMARKLKRELAPGFFSKAPEPVAPLNKLPAKTVSKYSESGQPNTARPVSARW